MALKLITAPTTTPVSLAEVKRHLKIDSAAEDARLEMFINAATELYDGETGLLGRAIVAQTWDLYLDEFPCGAIQIPLPPLASITSVKYDAPSGVETTISASNYTVDTVSTPGWVVPNSTYTWPVTLCAINAVRVRFVAGYSTVPTAIKLGLLETIGTMYANPQGVTAENVISNPQIWGFLAPYQASWF